MQITRINTTATFHSNPHSQPLALHTGFSHSNKYSAATRQNFISARSYFQSPAEISSTAKINSRVFLFRVWSLRINRWRKSNFIAPTRFLRKTKRTKNHHLSCLNKKPFPDYCPLFFFWCLFFDQWKMWINNSYI